jgi:hypothetical protein
MKNNNALVAMFNKDAFMRSEAIHTYSVKHIKNISCFNKYKNTATDANRKGGAIAGLNYLQFYLTEVIFDRFSLIFEMVHPIGNSNLHFLAT